MHRLFVALRPPAAMRAALLDAMGGVPQVRWQDDAQLHLTLRFIGAVERPLAEEVALALQTVDGPRPTIRVDGVGTFDRRGIVHTIFARIVADEALGRLHQRVERALGRIGLPAETRAFRPHVTLGRLNRATTGLEAFVGSRSALKSEPATLDAFLLFESMLGSEGATYHAIARYPLT